MTVLSVVTISRSMQIRGHHCFFIVYVSQQSVSFCGKSGFVLFVTFFGGIIVIIYFSKGLDSVLLIE